MAESKSTREQLIQAAGAEFAKLGFHNASVRKICGAIGANVSSIKYHFGSKEELYTAVLSEAAERQMTSTEAPPHYAKGDDADEALCQMIAWFLRRILADKPQDDWTARIMTQESASPSPVIGTVVEKFAKPIRGLFLRVVADVIGTKVSKRELDDLTNGVLALCVNPKHSRAILTCFGTPPPTTVKEINRFAATLSRFALAGLKGYRDGGTP